MPFMTIKITKSLSNDFSGGLNTQQLHSQIVKDVGITANCLTVKSTGGDVDIIFDTSLTGPEETTLDLIIAAHTPDNAPSRANFFPVTPAVKAIFTESWQLVLSFKFEGSDSVGAINYFDLLAFKNSAVTSYEARIVQRGTDLVLASSDALENDEMEVQTLGAVSNIPNSSTVLELQIKKVGGNKEQGVSIDQLLVYYGN